MNKTQLETAKDIINDLDYKNAEMTDIANLISRVNNAIDDIRMGGKCFTTSENGQLLDAINQINLLLNIAEEKREKIQKQLNDLFAIVSNLGAKWQNNNLINGTSLTIKSMKLKRLVK